jgi:hypothetical protein
VNGYQRAQKAHRAHDPQENPRPATKAPRTHADRGDGDSLCDKGRGSYLITMDRKLVTCKRCLAFMEVMDE